MGRRMSGKLCWRCERHWVCVAAVSPHTEHFPCSELPKPGMVNFAEMYAADGPPTSSVLARSERLRHWAVAAAERGPLGVCSLPVGSCALQRFDNRTHLRVQSGVKA